MSEYKRDGVAKVGSYQPKAYDPTAYLNNGDREGWVDYHPTYRRKSRDVMNKRFPINLIEPIALEARGPVPPTVPDMDIIDFHAGIQHELRCMLCLEPWVIEVKRRWRKRAVAREVNKATRAACPLPVDRDPA